MENEIKRAVTPFVVIVFLAGFLGVFAGLSVNAKAFADDDAGVSGCSSVAVDPNASLEAQQEICGNAENFPSTSCGVSGHGTCSSPKTNDTLVDGTHCICLSQTDEVAV